MTHIVSNGKYLIADKRTSFMNGASGDGTGKVPGTRRSHFCRDDSIKITIPKERLVVSKSVAANKEPKLIKAVAMSGSNLPDYMHPVRLLLRIGDLTEYAAMLNANAFAQTSFSMMALVEDGSVCVLQRSKVRDEIRWSITTTSADEFAKGAYVAMGSGSEHRLLEEVYKKKEITLLDAFFYGSHLDRASTTDYSVYGLEEAHFFATVRPTEADVRESYNKVRGLFEFNKLKKRYLPILQ